MNIIEAFKSAESHDKYFGHLNDYEEEQNALFMEMVASVDQKFEQLLKGDNEELQKGEFLIPELPKFRKDMKGKRTSRATTKSLVSAKISGIQTLPSRLESSGDSKNDETFRRSSRLASKILGKQEATVVQLQPIRQSRTKGTNVFNDLKSLAPEPVAKVHTSPIALNETYIKEVPMSSNATVEKVEALVFTSTSVKLDPSKSIVLSNLNVKSNQMNAEASRRSSRVAQKNEHFVNSSEKIQPSRSEPSSPSLPPTKIRCVDISDSKRMSIRKRSLDSTICSTGMKDPISTSTPTNFIMGTPKNTHDLHESVRTPIRPETGKKLKSKPVIFTETSSSTNGRCTRNTSKILQEKNTNVKLIEEKCQEAQKKKEHRMKSSAEETKRKREERTRKAAALREANEKEKIEIALKQEKEKEIKLKYIQKLKDEKLRVETMKKRHLANLKVTELEKKKKEAAKLETLKKTAVQECTEYAIDHVSDGASSDEEENPKGRVPSWATKENRKRPLRIQAWLDRKELIRPWFFSEAIKYPKLEELFSENVRTRPRTSSAFWNSQVCFDEAFPIN